MKIMLVNNRYKPYDVGGAEKVVENLAKKSQSFGNEVVVVTLKKWSGWKSIKPQTEIKEGIKIYRYWAPNIFSFFNLHKHNFLLKLKWHELDVFNFWSARIFKKILKKEKPDIVHTHNLMGLGFMLPKAILGQKTKHIHTVHDVQLVEPSGILPWNHDKDNILQKMYVLINRMLFSGIDEVVFPSEFMKDFYLKRKFFFNVSCKVEYGNDKEGEKSLEKRSESVNRYLFVGSLVSHKGVEVLMKAWDSVKDSNKELHIAGAGDLSERVCIWSEDKKNVVFHGRLEECELGNLYNKCDCLVFPSICIENRPNVIVEAMEHNLKIIAADTGGVKELLIGYDNYKLVEPSNTDALIAQIN